MIGGDDHDRFGDCFVGDFALGVRYPRHRAFSGDKERAPNPRGKGAPQVNPNRRSDPRAVGSTRSLRLALIIQNDPLFARRVSGRFASCAGCETVSLLASCRGCVTVCLWSFPNEYNDAARNERGEMRH